jgi:DNA-binding NtrC family response regulator
MPRPDRFVLDPETASLLNVFKPLDIDCSRTSSMAEGRAAGYRLFQKGQLGDAEAQFREAYRHAVRQDDQRSAMRIRLDLGRALLDRSHGEILGLLKPLEGSTGVDHACAYNLIGAVLQKMCLPDLAARNLERAAHISSSDRNPGLEACALANWGGALFMLGDFRAADALLLRARRKLEETNSPRKVGMLFYNQAVKAVLRQKYDEAFLLLEHGDSTIVRGENLYVDLMLQFIRGELELVTGSIASAIEHMETTERLATHASQTSFHARALMWRSIARDETPTVEVISQCEAVAKDLQARSLRNDSAMVLMMTGTWARLTSDVPYEHLLSKAQILFRNNPEAQLLEAHYTRIMEALNGSRRRSPTQPFPCFLTQAPAILSLKDQLRRLINTEVRIVLEGESGTGKTFLARQLHETSRRKKSPFVVVDCTNLEENLFESKLFGHRRGSFTGAVSDRVGLIEQANKGTLFLDEFGELPVEIQAKLLYTIEEQRYRPVGSRVEKKAEFRVLAATNRDIDQMLENGQLREDLFYRLSGFRVKLPPLRERREDIAPLAKHQINMLNDLYGRKKTLKAETWDAIAKYGWPGNVRELNATLERGFHLAAGRRIGLDDLGLGLSTVSLDAEDLSWYSVRRAHLLKVLRMCRGNVTRSAKLLGVNRTTLIYKLKLLDIERPDFDPAFQGQDQREGATPRLVADHDQAKAIAESVEEPLKP